MSCISPASLGGGEAFDLSFSEGFGGSPGRTIVKYASESGEYSKPELGTTETFDVGLTGKTRPQFAVRYEISRTARGSEMSVTFEDKYIIELQKTSVFLARKDFPSPPSSSCVIVLGSIYHKDEGAPSKASLENSVIPGPAPRIKDTNGNLIPAVDEMVIFTSAEFASALGDRISPALAAEISASGKMFDSGGSVIGLIRSCFEGQKVELYANDQGKLDILSSTSGSDGNISNLGQCNIVSITESSDITNNTSYGGYVTYDKTRDVEKDKTDKFRNLDLLCLPLRGCGGNGGSVSLLKADMDDTYLLHLKRLLKVAYLSQEWSGWNGFESFLMIKRSAGNGTQSVIDESNIDWLWGDSNIGSDTNYEVKEIPQIDRAYTGSMIKFTNFENAYSNQAVDHLFECLKTGKLDRSQEAIEDQISSVFDMNFDTDAKRKDAQPPTSTYGDFSIVLLATPDANDPNAAEGESSDAGDGYWEAGRNAPALNHLKVLLETVGKYWFLPGAGGGGGAKGVKASDKWKREYSGPNQPQWYEKDLVVTSSPFSDIYEKVFGPYFQAYEEAGGVPAPKGAEKNTIGDETNLNEPKHLSISQFLQLIAKLKNEATSDSINIGDDSGPDGIIADAFSKGAGKTRKQLSEEQEKALENCQEWDPVGVYLMKDEGLDKIPVPESNNTLASMSNGIDTNSDSLGDASPALVALDGYVLGKIYNPTEKKSNLKGPDKEPMDDIDGALDGFGGEGSIFDLIGQRRVKKVDYIEKSKDRYANVAYMMPECDGDIYSVEFKEDNLTDTILRRETDCFGRAKESNKEWTGADSAAVDAALNSKASSMYYIDRNSQVKTVIKTCGPDPANMPSASQGLEGFSVRTNNNGSVNSSLTVGGSVRSIASRAIKNGVFNSRNGGIV